MTEIQFLATLLLNEKIDSDSKTTIINRIIELSKPVMTPYISTPFVYTPSVDLCVHEYPNPWMGITAPFCKKCGKQAQSWLTVTGTGGTVTALPAGDITTTASLGTVKTTDVTQWTGNATNTILLHKGLA
jgi:hypothetical protein